MYNFWYLSYLIAETYTVYCNRNGGRDCTVTPAPPRRVALLLTDDLSSPIDAPVELSLSPELSMFFAYLLRFFIFHLLGFAICWACTMSFRRSARR